MNTEVLTQIYNTLSTIDTHGESTIKMALCLDALANVIKQAEDDKKHCNDCDCDKESA